MRLAGLGRHGDSAALAIDSFQSVFVVVLRSGSAGDLDVPCCRAVLPRAWLITRSPVERVA
jgi:hypothetical protein